MRAGTPSTAWSAPKLDVTRQEGSQLSKLGKLFKDYMELGYVQPLKLPQFLDKFRTPDRAEPVEWWYLGTGNYYRYIAERWGRDHRMAWKIDKEETVLSGVKHFRPKGGADRLVGVLLTEEIVSAM